VSRKRTHLSDPRIVPGSVRHFVRIQRQEWESKHASLADLDATWHFIGHCKATRWREHCSCFIPSTRWTALLWRALERAKKEFTTNALRAQRRARNRKRWPEGVRCCLSEARPCGCEIGATTPNCRAWWSSLRLPNLELRLMGVPPTQDAEKARPIFAICGNCATAACAIRRRNLAVSPWGCRFEVAIVRGATKSGRAARSGRKEGIALSITRRMEW